MRVAHSLEYRKYPGTSFENTVSLTVQSSEEECNINNIVQRFLKTGQMPQGIRVPTSIDFDGVFDFQTAQNILADGARAFTRLPVAIRKRFGFDPVDFTAFCLDEKNLPELRKLGLANPEVVPVPEKIVKVEVTNPVPPVSSSK